MSKILRFTKRKFCSPVPQARFTKLFIDGKWVKSSDGGAFPTLNPHNEEVIAEVQEASNQDVDAAVSAAQKAFNNGPWRKASAFERSECLNRLHSLILQNKEEIAMLEALDTGKPAKMAQYVDVIGATRILRNIAGLTDKMHGETIPIDGNFHAYTRQEPVGVCAGIVPWNYPFVLAMNKLAHALAAGCTIVLKSAENTPLTALRLAELTKQAGIPDGVVNILSGHGGTTGRYLASHPGVDKIAFTGSRKVGLEIMQNAAKNNLKRVTLELGGKSPSIVCSDANVDLAVGLLNTGIFSNTGQICFAPSRTFVHESIYDEYVEKSIKFAQNLKMGSQFEPSTTLGPLISQNQMSRVLGYIKSGQEEGAKILTGGQREGEKGFFVQPTIFTDVNDDSKISREEIFGPVSCISKFSDEEDAVQRANNTEYGLASYIFTQSVEKSLHLTNSLRTGMVFHNCFHLPPNVPFGGFKDSGLGRENGRQGIEGYLENKTVIMATNEQTLP